MLQKESKQGFPDVNTIVSREDLIHILLTRVDVKVNEREVSELFD